MIREFENPVPSIEQTKPVEPYLPRIQGIIPIRRDRLVNAQIESVRVAGGGLKVSLFERFESRLPLAAVRKPTVPIQNRSRPSPEEVGIFEEKVKVLREQGKKNIVIARQLHVSENTVGGAVRRLIARDEIPQRRDTAKRGQTERTRTFDEQVKTLRDQGLAMVQISAKLVISESRVKEAMSRLRANSQIERTRPSAGEVVAFDARVKTLREKGLRNNQIAEQLEVPESRIEAAAIRLMDAGEIAPRARTKKRGQRAFDNKVKRLRRAGFQLSQIAREIGETKTRVTDAVRRLIAAGEIERRKKPQTAKTILRDEEVARFRKQGLSYDEIVAQLNISKSKVGASMQRLLKAGLMERANSSYIAAFDGQVQELRFKGLTVHEIAEELFVKELLVELSVHRLLAAGKITSRKGRRNLQTIQFDQEVKKRRVDGMGNIEIARQLEVPKTRVENAVRRLTTGKQL